MSVRDQGLLKAAGMNIKDAVALFGRSRQAISAGLCGKRDYFAGPDAAAIYNYVKKLDYKGIGMLVEFIELNYPEAQAGNILPGRIGYERLERAVSTADEIIIAFNGNTETLSPTAALSRTLIQMLNDKRHVDLFVPGAYAGGSIGKYLGLTIPPPISAEEVAYFPSFLILKEQNICRAFMFMRFAAEEMLPQEAERLWNRYATMRPQRSLDTSTAAA